MSLQNKVVLPPELFTHLLLMQVFPGPQLPKNAL